MDPKAQLVAYLQSMQAGGGPQGGAPMMQPGEMAGDPTSPDNTPEHENAESADFEKSEGSEEDANGQEQYSHADMIAHHDSIAGLVQILLNLKQKGSGNAKPMMASPSALEAKQGGYA